MKNVKMSLAVARVNVGLTQEKVAEIMHVSKKTIVNWEKGLSTPKISQAKMLSGIYEMPLDDIFF